MSSCEGLVERGGLNHSLVGKLLVRGGDDAQSWRRLPLRMPWGLGGKSRGTSFALLRALHGGVAWLGSLLQAQLDDVSLVLSHRDAALQLLPHRGVLRDEAGRQACQTDIVNHQSGGLCSSRGQWARRWSRRRWGGAGFVLGEVEFARSVARGRELRRRWRFLLDRDLRRHSASSPGETVSVV